MYQKTQTANLVQRMSDGANLAVNGDHRWSREYRDWLAAGNLPAEYAISAAEEVLDATKQKIEADKAVAKQYSKLRALTAMSPAEVQVWAEANVKTLPDAKDTIITLAIAVSILARQL